MEDLILFLITFALSVILLFIAVMQFCNRGFLFVNAYIFGTKEERDNMDKTPYYKQAGIVFTLLSIVFLIISIEIITHIFWLFFISIAISIIDIIYAILSSIQIEKNK